MSDNRAFRVVYDLEYEPIKRQAIDILFKPTAEDAMTDDNKPDLVNHPPHYTQHPSGIECIQITEHLNFCLGNAIKYIWRRGEKDDEIQDLRKAAWYINREIARLEKQREVPT
jgi:hypothetical protein